jgi:hypothetical protein
MSLSVNDLQDFQRFADERVRVGAVESLVELAGQWEAERREIEATVADIRESHADIESGRVTNVADAFAEIRQVLRRDSA